MPEPRSARNARIVNVTITAVTLAILAAVIWIDVTSQVWQETVILSGVAAGLVTFLLTALFLERAMARREHRKWYPVTRLALSDLLHTIADDQRSDIHRGQVVARSLELPETAEPEVLDSTIRAVVVERDEITAVLARWAQFLAASADVQDLMSHIATLAESLDAIRDQAVEMEQNPQADAGLPMLRSEVRRYNAASESAIKEILAVQADLT